LKRSSTNWNVKLCRPSLKLLERNWTLTNRSPINEIKDLNVKNKKDNRAVNIIFMTHEEIEEREGMCSFVHLFVCRVWLLCETFLRNWFSRDSTSLRFSRSCILPSLFFTPHHTPPHKSDIFGLPLQFSLFTLL
jgi:hypothetical protein